MAQKKRIISFANFEIIFEEGFPKYVRKKTAKAKDTIHYLLGPSFTFKNGKLFGNPIPHFPQPMGFEGKIIGFDKNSYIYIKIMDEKIIAANKTLIALITDFYSNLSPDLGYNYEVNIAELQIGELLVAKIKPGEFRRVKLLSTTSGKQDNFLTVVDVDTEIAYEVMDSDLYLITEPCLSQPFLAIRCKLYGFEYFMETDVLGTVLKPFSKYPTVQITAISPNALIPTIVILPHDPCYNGKTVVSFNSILKKAISDYNPFQTDMKKGTMIKGGEVFYTDGNGALWYQMKSGVLDFLENLVPKKGLDFPNTDEIKKLIQMGVKTFAAPSANKHGKYCRVTIIPDTFIKENYQAVRYTDSGVPELLEFQKLIPLNYFDPILNDIPPQCMKFQLGPRETFKQKDLASVKKLVMNHDLQICENMVMLRNKLPVPPIVRLCIYFPDDYDHKKAKRLDEEDSGSFFENILEIKTKSEALQEKPYEVDYACHKLQNP